MLLYIEQERLLQHLILRAAGRQVRDKEELLLEMRLELNKANTDVAFLMKETRELEAERFF
jgi:hypothetical protein